jgi:hypothetical protein
MRKGTLNLLRLSIIYAALTTTGQSHKHQREHLAGDQRSIQIFRYGIEPQASQHLLAPSVTKYPTANVRFHRRSFGPCSIREYRVGEVIQHFSLYGLKASWGSGSRDHHSTIGLFQGW